MRNLLLSERCPALIARNATGRALFCSLTHLLSNTFQRDPRTAGSNPKLLTTDGKSWDPMFVKDKIVFISTRDGLSTTEVYSMNQDGTSAKRLTNDSASEYFDGW